MVLPLELSTALETGLAKYKLNQLAQAAARLSERYRLPEKATGNFQLDSLERAAYLAVRLPATFAAASAVLAEVRRLEPALRIESLLDLGAGPGTAMWAAAEIFGELQSCVSIERDNEFIRLGKSLAQPARSSVLRQAAWRQLDLQRVAELPPCDLAVCAYSLGELEAATAKRVAQHAWKAAQKIFVIIEPGTMRGFATIKLLRDELIAAGAHLVAPCPHARACPLPAGDWCHFAARFERSSLQRRLKAGTLGYEDEKFAYIAVAKQPVARATARILRHPQRQPGFTRLRLCTTEGLQETTIAKSDKETWKRARKAEWGDEWP